MTASARLSYSSIDDYLGPGQTRFFSHGYRRATYQVSDIVITSDGKAEQDVQATVSVEYPSDWSKKTGVDLRPHLSSIDMLVLGVQLSEMCLSHAFGLDEAMRRRMRLRRVTLKAGSSPQEDLEAIPASARHRGTKAVSDGADTFVSILDCKIGYMQARCEIEHQIARRVTAARYGTSVEDILGPAACRYYGDGFKLSQQLIEDVQVDMETLRSDATVRIESTEKGPTASNGIEGAYQPCVSMVDCFVVTLQLGQVMMYEMDGVARKDSDTLWMIRTVLQAEDPHWPYSSPLAARTAVTSKHLLRLRGGIWRNVDLVGQIGGVTVRCSFAHELPKGSTTAVA